MLDKLTKKLGNSETFRTLIFGLEDGLVSTGGVIIGVSAGVSEKRIILLAGLVTIAVEALSMAAGEYLSQKSSQQMKKQVNQKHLLESAMVMYLSYASAGLVPISAFLFFPVATARFVAIIASLTALFLIGFIKGKILGLDSLKSGIEFLLVGGTATLVGIVVGLVFGV
ncbi:VIT1/CCC1 transporter family protein [Candidatus Nomurabacteria bacterium]|nr:VIT1/CCC1 transporter family protein [Candidatus Nomurabacteria bacterium]